MNKIEYDKFFITQIPKMYEVIPKLISKYKMYHLEPDVVISEVYEHCLQFIDRFTTEGKCKSYIIRFINLNVSMYNSRMNRREKINNITEGYTYAEEIDDFEENIKNKIEIDKWFNNKKALIEQYRQQLTDKQMIIIYDCFFIKGFQTGKALAEHLGINKDYCLGFIRDLKEDIIQFEIKQFIKHNIR